VVVVRPDGILDVVREAAASGHRNLLILPGGFAEAGEEGKTRDRELRALAEAHGLSVAGPNCAGTIDLLDEKRPFAATFFRDLPRGGGVALISQSGAIAEEAVASSHTLGIPLGAMVSVGNAMQLGLGEYLEYFGADPACKAILLYAESFGDAKRFQALARAVRKPIVALIGGRTSIGRDAAFRHTGSTAMSNEDADAFCRAAGILRVSRDRKSVV
jgi:acetyltransferase